MERIVREAMRPWNLLIYRIGATMYRDPALNSARTLPYFGRDWGNVAAPFSNRPSVSRGPARVGGALKANVDQACMA